MIDPKKAIAHMEDKGVGFVVGVPDSLMKGFCSELDDWGGSINHVVAPNEGSAVAAAAGHYLGSHTPAVVYMQNSGLGNAVNPLTSLASGDVYGIPMVLMIGWRGEPGVKDEPQHGHQGRVTPDLLATLDIPTTVVRPDTDFQQVFADAYDQSISSSGPVALLVGKGSFAGQQAASAELAGLSRIEAVEAIVGSGPEPAVYVATTGFTGRELALVRDRVQESWERDFLMVGSMGHASAISVGIAKSRPNVRVICLDGDGALAMHMGNMALVGREKPTNLIHILLNNGVHESVGGQESVATAVSWKDVALSSGYTRADAATDADGLGSLMDELSDAEGPVFVEVSIRTGSVEGLPRPAEFTRRRDDFMSFLDDA